MNEFTYEDLRFTAKEGHLRATFLRYFYFDISHEELSAIGAYELLDAHTIAFEGNRSKVERTWGYLIDLKIKNDLMTVNGAKAVYVHSGPLVGSQRFGIIDSDTNCVELRPITWCNINCIFCSVDEGIKSTKVNYVVDKDLLIEEFKRVIQKKGDVYAHIGSQGEPMMYVKMPELVADLAAIPQVKMITITTNGTLLTKEGVDQLAEAGLPRINVSLNAIDQDISDKLAGTHYPVERIKEMLRYVVTKMELVIAPVFMKGLNDDQIPKIVEFAREIGAKLGIQNFLEYKHGRNPVESIPFDEFRKYLEGIDPALLKPELGFPIESCKTLQKPFRKGDVIKVEKIYAGYGVAEDRLVKIPMNSRERCRVKLIRDKHNIFTAVHA